MPFRSALESHLLVCLDMPVFVGQEEPYRMPRQPVESPVMVGEYALALIQPAIFDAGKQRRPARRCHVLYRDWTGENIGAVRQGRPFLLGQSLTRRGS